MIEPIDLIEKITQPQNPGHFLEPIATRSSMLSLILIAIQVRSNDLPMIVYIILLVAVVDRVLHDPTVVILD